ncbi:heavy-metal-associated domain-containing protein [Paracoccus xiamenensis]|uniref:heavy-metal-associated domain-containing protein n=1 Tax=Paracoccus xiamenensis TaxID=2714901 RepID=UPI00140CB727|nr:heavy metal-associated domain-containing protein [Paracoccus xiamenensis]NHF72092.1 heavy-metal-associated domain-containing protein [Paracoccus xiamenensis]
MKLSVPDMSCAHCKAAIEKAVSDAGGSATVDLERHEVIVDGLDPADAQNVIRQAGYDPRLA